MHGSVNIPLHDWPEEFINVFQCDIPQLQLSTTVDKVLTLPCNSLEPLISFLPLPLNGLENKLLFSHSSLFILCQALQIELQGPLNGVGDISRSAEQSQLRVGKGAFMTQEDTYTNQKGDTVAVVMLTIFRFVPPQNKDG